MPPDDRAALLEAGAKAVFTADMPLEHVIGELSEKLRWMDRFATARPSSARDRSR